MFLLGWRGKPATRSQVEQSLQFRCLEPEYARRLIGAMQECEDDGHNIGIGGSIRTSAAQLAGFLRVHRPAEPGEPIPRTCRNCILDGVQYVLLPHTAHKAKPGNSYHEPLLPPFPPVVLAADMIGDRHIFATSYAPRWGLRDFAKVNGEEWHIQPVDIPASRSKLKPTHLPLKRWPREEGDMAQIVTLEGDPLPWIATGTVLQRVSTSAAATWRFLGVKQGPTLKRDMLKVYPLPCGDLGPFTPADFDQIKAA